MNYQVSISLKGIAIAATVLVFFPACCLTASATDPTAAFFARMKNSKTTSQSFLTPKEEQAYKAAKLSGSKAQEEYARAKAAADQSKPLIQSEQERVAAMMRAKSNVSASAIEAQEAARVQSMNAAKAASDYQAVQARTLDFKKRGESAEKANNQLNTVLHASVNCPKKLKPGSECHLTVTTTPNAECHTTINFGSGPTDKKTLPDLTADSAGNAEFVFTVPECHRSYLMVNAECSLGSAKVIEMKKVDVEQKDDSWLQIFKPKL